MVKLRTLKDIKLCLSKEWSKQVIRIEIKKWIKAIQLKEADHWKKLDKFGYVDFPKSDNEEAEWFKLEGMRFASWHEASPEAAIMVLKHFFNLEEE